MNFRALLPSRELGRVTARPRVSSSVSSEAATARGNMGIGSCGHWQQLEYSPAPPSEQRVFSYVQQRHAGRRKGPQLRRPPPTAARVFWFASSAGSASGARADVRVHQIGHHGIKRHADKRKKSHLRLGHVDVRLAIAQGRDATFKLCSGSPSAQNSFVILAVHSSCRIRFLQAWPRSANFQCDGGHQISAALLRIQERRRPRLLTGVHARAVATLAPSSMAISFNLST